MARKWGKALLVGKKRLYKGRCWKYTRDKMLSDGRNVRDIVPESRGAALCLVQMIGRTKSSHLV
jgi:hypothetical protein